MYSNNGSKNRRVVKLCVFSTIAALLGLLLVESLLSLFFPTGYALRHITEWDHNSYYALDLSSSDHACPFPKKKSEDEIRIFTYGGSSTHGNPYGYGVCFSRFLAQILSDWYPQKKIRVINLGFFAKTFSDAVDWAKEAADYSPDYFVFYSGHNEIYPHNIAAAKNPMRFSFLWHLRDFMRRYSHIYSSMERFFRRFDLGTKRKIPFAGIDPKKELGFVLANYQRNLDHLISFTPHSTKILLVTPIANLRSWHPPGPPQPPGGDQRLYSQLLSRTERGLEIVYSEKAEAQVRRWRNEPSTYAIASFWLGHFALQKGNQQLGKKLLRDASVSHIYIGRVHNGILSLLRSRHLVMPNVQFLDVEATLETLSPYGVIGKEWILDWCHPSDEAHFEIALQIARHIVRDRRLAPSTTGMDPAFSRDIYIEKVRKDFLGSEDDSAMFSLTWRQFDQAVALCDRVLQRGLGSSRTRICKALALWEIGRQELAKGILLDELAESSVASAEGIVLKFFPAFGPTFHQMMHRIRSNKKEE